MNRRILFAVFLVILLPVQVFAAIPNDSDYDELWHLPQISAPDAWDVTTGSREIIVAVLDAGVDIDHPDLEPNLWTNPGEIAGNGIDDDQNGFADDVHGWDFVRRDSDPGPDMSNKAIQDAIVHGSIVAGIAGAKGNNSEGITGVNWNVTIMPVRMLNDVGSGTSFQAAAAVDYAVQNGANVINLSFSGPSQDLPLRGAIKDAYEAGVVVVAAMGNDGQDTDLDPVYPACYEGADDWVIGVVSSGATDEKSSFSNYGNNCADIAAPGELIYSTSYEDGSAEYSDLYIGNASGTSMAAPVVSGAVALILSEYPDLSPDDVRRSLKLSVDPLSGPLATKSGAGRLNVARALEYAASFSDGTGTDGDGGVDSLEDGDAFTSPSFSTVYALEDEKRRAFINANAYFTYHDSFDDITNVEDGDLSQFGLSGLVLPKAGVVLVKIQSDPRVYALEENPDDQYAPLLREIASEEIAIEMYGASWADYVIDIEPTFFTRFGTGEILEEAEDVDVSIMKTRAELAALAL